MMRNNQAGVGLIEVLVSLLILAIGVLGFAGLQMRALQSSGEAQFQVQAAAIADDIASRIKLNEEKMDWYRTASNWTNATQSMPPTNCVASACTPDQMADFDVKQANYAVQNLLPNGRVRVEPCLQPTTHTCVYIAWNNTQPTAGSAGQCVNASDMYVNGADCVKLPVTPSE